MGSPDVTPDDPSTLTVHSSWFGIVGSVIGALVVLTVGVLAVGGVGARLIPLGILVVGLLLTAGVLFDYPIATRFDSAGVQRRPLLRRQSIPWDRVDGLSRARPALRASTKGFAPGGLVAVVGRRRYLLVDRPEAGSEFDQLKALLPEWGIDLPLGSRPPDGVAPTWLYRRRRWRPSATGDR